MSGSGIPLIAYEGGQHVTSYSSELNRRPEMYQIYKSYLKAMSPFYSLFVHYCLTGGAGYGGSWGAQEYTGQSIAEAHKLRAMKDWVMECPLDVTTGVKDNEIKYSENIIVYPNPIENNFILEGAEPGSRLVLYDIAGRELYSKQINTSIENVDVEHFAKGSYVLKIINNQKGIMEVRKIMKQ